MPQSIDSPIASSSATFETPLELEDTNLEENEIADAIADSIFEEGATFALNPWEETQKSGETGSVYLLYLFTNVIYFVIGSRYNIKRFA